MESNGIRPKHIIGGIILFAVGLFYGLNNMHYVVEFIKGSAQPVLIIIGLTAIAAAIKNGRSSLRWMNFSIGFVLLPLGIYGIYDEYYATMDFINGILPISMVVGGLIALIYGIGQVKTENQGNLENQENLKK